jgi:hypothetical protein
MLAPVLVISPGCDRARSKYQYRIGAYPKPLAASASPAR